MKKYIASDNFNNHFYCEYPEKCPVCNSMISPNKMWSFNNKELKMLFVLFECPACEKGFVSHYKYLGSKVSRNSTSYEEIELIDSYPSLPVIYEFDNNIKKISPEFCSIYNEALSAEHYQLNSIAGMGYRKALEFLIKDYSINKCPDEIKKIKNMNLSQVIDKYIDGQKLHSLATASTWIGNDETHYTKKIENKDVNDLKRFIASAVAYITYDLTADEAFEMVNLESK